MVTITAKISYKGQIVIPKVFRKEYGIDTESDIIMQDTPQGILLQRSTKDIAQEFAKLASQNKKKFVLPPFEEQYELRLKKSGLV